MADPQTPKMLEATMDLRLATYDALTVEEILECESALYLGASIAEGMAEEMAQQERLRARRKAELVASGERPYFVNGTLANLRIGGQVLAEIRLKQLELDASYEFKTRIGPLILDKLRQVRGAGSVQVIVETRNEPTLAGLMAHIAEALDPRTLS